MQSPRNSVRFKPIVVPKSQQTPDDILVHSESNLLVFISSVTDELKWARDEAVRTFERFPCAQPWAFEYTPASSESADDAYLKKAKDADLLVWLVGSQTTQPVVNEINARIATGRRLLVFKLPAEDRDPLTRKLLTTVSGYCKWQKVNSGPTLREALTASLSDEIARALRDPAQPTRRQKLRQQLDSSFAKCKQLWITLDVPSDLATELANEPLRKLGLIKNDQD